MQITERSAEIDVVIVTHNAAPVLPECLDALSGADKNLNLIVVDNASSDGTLALLQSRKVSVVPLRKNVGFGAACNIGARLGAADTVLFLNPDTIAEPKNLLLCRQEMHRGGHAVLGCRLVQSNGEFDHAAKRAVVSPLIAASFLFRRSKDSPYLANHLGELDSGSVDSVNGAFLMMTRESFEKHAGFDEDYWMYMEDMDLCWRVKKGGGNVHYWGGVTVTHLKSAITGKSRAPKINYHFHKSMWIFYRKHQSSDDGRLMRLGVFGGVMIRGVLVTVRDVIRRWKKQGLPVKDEVPRNLEGSEPLIPTGKSD